MGKLRINFFEEFYTTSSLISRCKQIPFASTVYIACKSFDEFLTYERTLKKEAPHIELGYWPILPKSYWISPFSFYPELFDLYKILSQYNGKGKIKVLLDLELPLLNPSLFFTNLLSFRKNKKTIERLFSLGRRGNIQFFSAEYNLPITFFQYIGRLLGVHYSHKRFNYKTIFMRYNSSITQIFNIDLTISAVKKYTYNEIALGIIAPGIFKETNLLSPEILKNDLEKINNKKITTVTIFSLAGFVGEYKKILSNTGKSQ